MNAAKKIINAFAFNPIPSHTIVKGIQEMGGIGRMISKIGFQKNLSRPLYHPISSPNGTPVTIANKSPVRATCKLASVATGNVEPSGEGSDNF